MAVITKAPDKRYTPKSGQVLDARFYTEEILEFGRNSDFGNDVDDRTTWIDLAGAEWVHVEIDNGSFVGSVRFEFSNNPNTPPAGTGQGVYTSSVSVSSQSHLNIKLSPSDDEWGKWVRFFVNSKSANGQILLRFYIRRLESRRD